MRAKGLNAVRMILFDTWEVEASFNDSAWPSGPARLCFGGDGEVTQIASNRLRVTTYFRRAFTVTNPSGFPALTLCLLRDDGAVVYLNGNEIFRSNPCRQPAEDEGLTTDAL